MLAQHVEANLPRSPSHTERSGMAKAMPVLNLKLSSAMAITVFLLQTIGLMPVLQTPACTVSTIPHTILLIIHIFEPFELDQELWDREYHL